MTELRQAVRYVFRDESQDLGCRDIVVIVISSLAIALLAVAAIWFLKPAPGAVAPPAVEVKEPTLPQESLRNKTIRRTVKWGLYLTVLVLISGLTGAAGDKASRAFTSFTGPLCNVLAGLGVFALLLWMTVGAWFWYHYVLTPAQWMKF
jgi:hypothetical protein